jgi:hypothetical protein
LQFIVFDVSQFDDGDEVVTLLKEVDWRESARASRTRAEPATCELCF